MNSEEGLTFSPDFQPSNVFHSILSTNNADEQTTTTNIIRHNTRPSRSNR